jgi:DNA-binding NarL/FixJ family response regulator
MLKVLHLDYSPEHYEWTKAQLQRLSKDLRIDYAIPSEVEHIANPEMYDCVLIDDQLLDNGARKFLNRLREGRRLTPVVIQTDCELDGSDGFQTRALWNDDFNVMITFARYDLLNLWIHRLIDQHKVYFMKLRLKSEFSFDGPQQPDEPQSLKERLTNREIEVLGMIAHGMSNKEISSALGISYRTAVNHVQNLFRKLNIHSRTEAIRYAVMMQVEDVPVGFVQ